MKSDQYNCFCVLRKAKARSATLYQTNVFDHTFLQTNCNYHGG
jgi:hypothetical protein